MPSYPIIKRSNIHETSEGVIIKGSLFVDNDVLTVDSVNNRVGVLTSSPEYVLDVNGDIRIRAGGSLYFSDGSSINTAGGGSAESLSSNSDIEVTSDADANASGDINLNIASRTIFKITNSEEVRIDDPTTGLGANSPVFSISGNYFTGAVDNEIRATFEVISNSNPYLRITISDDGATPIDVGILDLYDTVIQPVTNNSVDLGSLSKKFKDLYLSGDISSQSLILSGGLSLSYVEKTSDYTLTSTDCICIVDASSGDVEITLPTAALIGGKNYIIKKIDSSANQLIITPDGVETIDYYQQVFITNQWVSISLISNNVDAWYII